MNGSGLIILLVALALAAMAWASILFVIPNAMRSIFRYNLWAIRDEIVDGVLSREVPRDEALALVKRIEITIQNAPDLSVLNLWAVQRATRKTSAAAVPDPLVLNNRRLKDYAEQWQALSLRHAVLGSPSGWIAVIAVAAVWLPYRVFGGRRPVQAASSERPSPQERISDRLEGELAVVSSPGWPAHKGQRKSDYRNPVMAG